MPGSKQVLYYFKLIRTPKDVIYTADEDIYDYISRYNGHGKSFLNYCMKNSTIHLNAMKLTKRLRTLNVEKQPVMIF